MYKINEIASVRMAANPKIYCHLIKPLTYAPRGTPKAMDELNPILAKAIIFLFPLKIKKQLSRVFATNAEALIAFTTLKKNSDRRSVLKKIPILLSIKRIKKKISVFFKLKFLVKYTSTGPDRANIRAYMDISCPVTVLDIPNSKLTDGIIPTMIVSIIPVKKRIKKNCKERSVLILFFIYFSLPLL